MRMPDFFGRRARQQCDEAVATATRLTHRLEMEAQISADLRFALQSQNMVVSRLYEALDKRETAKSMDVADGNSKLTMLWRAARDRVRELEGGK